MNPDPGNCPSAVTGHNGKAILAGPRRALRRLANPALKRRLAGLVGLLTLGLLSLIALGLVIDPLVALSAKLLAIAMNLLGVALSFGAVLALVRISFGPKISDNDRRRSY